MNTKLEQIADISTGYIKRTGKKPAESISIPIIQLGDIDRNGIINYDDISTEKISGNDRYPQLQKGNVIFAAKGSRRSAGLIDKHIEGLTASNHFLILRIISSQVLPEYLAFYLRQKPAMDYFDRCATGSHIPFVSAAALKDLVIAIPALEKQKQLAELDSLINEEKKLVEKLQDMKKNYYEQLLAGLIGEVDNV